MNFFKKLKISLKNILLSNVFMTVEEIKEVRETSEGNIFTYCHFNHKLFGIFSFYRYKPSEVHSFNDEPAFINEHGIKTWFRYGDIHRDGDLPARDWNNGIFDWYKNDKKHRVNGPARLWPNGREEWYFEGDKHREDGPAVVLGKNETYNGEDLWWYKGEACTIDKWCELTGKSKEETVYLKLRYGGRYVQNS